MGINMDLRTGKKQMEKEKTLTLTERAALALKIAETIKAEASGFEFETLHTVASLLCVRFELKYV